MILHSIVPAAAMQQMIYEENPFLPSCQTISISDTKAVSGCMQNGKFIVGRIISTDPDDFLHPEKLLNKAKHSAF